jgi:hypothetical protein
MLRPRGYRAAPVDEQSAISFINDVFSHTSTSLELVDMRPKEQTKHYITIKRPIGSIPDLQSFTIRWIFVVDAIGFYSRYLSEASYEYYVYQNYTSALMGDTHSYARIVPLRSEISWMRSVIAERRHLVEADFVIPFNEVFSDVKEQMEGAILSDPRSPLSQMVQEALGIGSGGGWATER